MSRQRARTVRIINPPSNSKGLIARAKAVNMVHRHRATWTDASQTSIKLRADIRERRAAVMAAVSARKAKALTEQELACRRGYDGVRRVIRPAEAANIPVVNYIKLLTVRNRHSEFPGDAA